MNPSNNPIVKEPREIEPKLQDDAPLAKNGENINDGVKLLDAIYRLFTTREPVGFCTIKKYRNYLDLELKHPWLFKIVLIPFLLLDFIQSVVILIALLLVLFLIIFALAKLVGFTDWYENLIQKQTQVQYVIQRECVDVPNN